MKLPLRRPSTSSSPSGYAAVISWPSSRTRRAIVSSSKTIRLSSRPPVCLRPAVLGNIHPYRPGSGPREIVSTPADSGDPQNGFAAGDDRVAGPVAARHARFHQHPPQRPPPDAAQGHQPVARTRRPHLPVGSRDPGRPLGPRQPGRRDRKSTRLNSSHPSISYALFCLKKKTFIAPLHTFSLVEQRINVSLSAGRRTRLYELGAV